MAVVGWDIGGAHLKAARCEEGRIVATAQVAAPLRLGLERLVQAFAEAKALIGSANSHAVTMTGNWPTPSRRVLRGLRVSPAPPCASWHRAVS